MRPFQVAIIAICVVAALGGLYFFATFKGFGGAAKPVGAVVIWGTLPQAAFAHEITALKVTHKEFSDVSYSMHPARTFEADLADALASGNGPDLVLISQEQLLAERNKISLIPFSSISQRAFLNTYLPIDSLFLTSQGFYGIPLVVDPLVMYYNRPMLSSAGIASAPTSWEAITGLSATLTQKQSNQTVTRSTVALGGYGNVLNARAILSLLLLQAGNPITRATSDTTRSALADQSDVTAGVTPAEAAVGFYGQFANPAKTVYSWNRSLPEDQQAFTTGDLAFYFGYASERAFLSGANPNLNFDMAPMPQPATATTHTTYGLAYVFALPKAAKNSSGAFRTALALSANDVLPGLVKELGMAPAKRSLLSSSPDDAFAAVYYPEALAANGWLSPAPGATDVVFADMISNIATGRQDVHTALFSADQAMNAAL